MKKNLRNILTLALGFVTVLATAQTWDANSRTRVNMSGENDQFTTSQRTSMGVNWGGDGWGIAVSGNANVDHLGTSPVTMNWNEATMTADLMGFASVTIGRQALNYGSGALIGSNDWGQNPNTRDGGLFTFGLDMVDLDLGYYRNQADVEDSEANDAYFINAAKGDGAWNANLFMYSDSDDNKAMGLDLGYSLMDGALDLAVSYNTASDDDDATDDMDMMSLGATYNVNDDLSIGFSRAAYGDGGYSLDNTNMGTGTTESSWNSHGNMGYLNPKDVAMTLSLSYDMGDFSMSIGGTRVSNEDAAEGTDDREVNEASLSYSMNDNCSLGIKYASDSDDYDGDGEDDRYMWMTLSVTP